MGGKNTKKGYYKILVEQTTWGELAIEERIILKWKLDTWGMQM